MPYIADHKGKFADLDFNISNQDLLRRQANGGNSILFSYPPDEEYLYINRARELYDTNAEFIDISKLLVEFISKDGWESFADYYRDFKNTPHKVFSSDDPEIDLFDLIVAAINKASDEGKVPFLIRSGCLIGTGIENVNIMEHKDIMGIKHPLVLFYPSKLVEGNLLFLNFKPASKYRCTLVN